MILSQFSLLFNDTQNFRGEVKQNESLAKHCTMRVGGEAKLYIEPFDTESLIFALKSAEKAGLDFYLLGGGSNTIFPDEGLNLVICTKKIGFGEPAQPVRLLENSGKNESNFANGANNEKHILCSAGASWGSVLGFCKKNNLGGFEPFTALSGTVGGAVFMNASCFALSLSDNLVRVEYLDFNADSKPASKQLEIRNYEFNADDWGYKRSPFQNSGVRNREEKRKGGVTGDFPPLKGVAENAQAVGARGTFPPHDKNEKKIILSAEFKVRDGFDGEISENVRQKRVAMGHFRAASAGSAFKNEPEKGIVAGKLIDECALKGFSLGGAQIAPWHANFIINPDGKATAADIRALVETVQKKVFEEKGVLLEPEIIFA